MDGHLLIILPFPVPDAILQQLHDKHPNLKVTYLHHNVSPSEAFTKRDMFIEPDLLHEITMLMTLGVVPDPEEAPNLRYIHFIVAGTDHVLDKKALYDDKITITTSTGAAAMSIAEWVIGALLGHFRQLFRFKTWQESGKWQKLTPDIPISTLDGKVLGIAGYGSIGRQIARVAQPMGMKVVVYNSKPRDSAEDRRDKNYYKPGSGDPDGTIPERYYHGTSRHEFHNFLSQGLDVLVLSLPLTESTRHLIGSEELDMLNKPNPAFLVNIARGPIIDQAALASSLRKGPKNGGLPGAALDVATPEPLPDDHELWSLPNVFISPHVSAVTSHTIHSAFEILLLNIGHLVRGEKLVNLLPPRVVTASRV